MPPKKPFLALPTSNQEPTLSVRSRTGSRTRLCLRKSLFWRYPRPIRNRPCRCVNARKISREVRKVRKVLKISLRSLRSLRLKILVRKTKRPTGAVFGKRAAARIGCAPSHRGSADWERRLANLKKLSVASKLTTF